MTDHHIILTHTRHLKCHLGCGEEVEVWGSVRIKALVGTASTPLVVPLAHRVAKDPPYVSCFSKSSKVAMIFSTIVAFAALAEALPQFGGGGGSTMLRFGCSEVVIDRIDPLVNPGQAPSPHMHQVVGGNAFNTSMAEVDIAKLSTCTTCSYSDDFSNYWTANLYFKARNGSYKRVPQVPNRDLFGDTYTRRTNGGFVVYYVGVKGKMQAFKPGFRMLVGDANQRTKIGNGLKSQTCFRCYSGPNHQGDNAAPCADARLDTEALPVGACPGGIRSNILYPTCWDGVNLDSPDHKSHVAYPRSGPSAFTGTTTGADCPPSHPIRIPQLMLEIVWDTSKFNNKAEWPEDGSQPFVLSTGDPTGYGQHGDYVFGWKDDTLQKAMDEGRNCMGQNCGGLKSQGVDAGNKCRVPMRVKEDIDGWVDKLPGF